MNGTLICLLVRFFTVLD